MVDFSKIKQYFMDRLDKYGTTPQGLDWNSIESQHIRYEQLIRVIDEEESFSILDYGCGFGSLLDFSKPKDYDFTYVGFDIVEEMIEKGKQLHKEESNCFFTSNKSELKPADYVVESGIFNMRQNDRFEDWTDYVVGTLTEMNNLAKKGMAVNFLTKYSDPGFMRPDLYYADPCFLFDYCKINFSRNVALLHDYELYDFTILVRK
jgi:SAM-dependent methyltransferase